MIRINLLPEMRKKKPLVSPTIFVPGAVITGVTILVLVIFTFHLNSTLSALQTDKTIKEKRLSELQADLKEVENYERDNEAFREKNRIIEQLKKNQSVPLRLLDEVSKRLPKGVWLTSLTDRKGNVNINGYAFTNTDLVRYVQNLKGSTYIKDVLLVESRQTTLENFSIYKFKLTFRIK